jgi:hypothetical protein
MNDTAVAPGAQPSVHGRSEVSPAMNRLLPPNGTCTATAAKGSQTPDIAFGGPCQPKDMCFSYTLLDRPAPPLGPSRLALMSRADCGTLSTFGGPGGLRIQDLVLTIYDSFAR